MIFLVSIAQSQSTANDHFIITVVTLVVGVGTILGWIWKASNKLVNRFEAVESGLREVKQEQEHQRREQTKIKKKIKVMQLRADAEVLAQTIERKRVTAQ